MTEDSKQEATTAVTSSGIGVRNVGEPLRFTDVEPIGGFAAESAKAGQSVKICTRLALSSDEPLFHRLVESLSGVVRHMAQKAGSAINLGRADMVLLIFKPDNTVELWMDTAAVSLQCIIKRAVAARSVVFEHDIADVVGMGFPCVTIDKKDKVLCLFREGWSFGLAFDFNPDGNLDLDWFSTALGTLYRTLRYRHLYKTMADPAIFDPLLGAGWFPFVEIITTEFRELARHVEAKFDIAELEANIVAAFDAARLGHVLDRWAAKPHFAAKATLLREC